MKIIHLVLGKANPNRMNGVNKLVCEMATVQTALGADVTLWGITKKTIHDYPERNFKTVLFPSKFNKTKIDSSLINAIENLKEDTIFHLHGSFIPEFFLISRFLVKKQIPYIYTPHGALAPGALARRGWKKKWYFDLFEKKLIQDSQTVVATGKSVFDNLDKLVDLKKKVLIPNGQPKLSFQAKRFDTIDPLIFGYCGRIAFEHKGLDLLLQGFKKFIENSGNAELRIIGDGEELPKLKHMVTKLELDKHIKFYGALFGEEKFKLLAETNMFVHTSRMEGFPAAVLEASALGLPCLISKATNVGDYIKKYNCGIVCDPNTPEEIARSMEQASQLLKNGVLKTYSENAITMIENEFDWKIICKKLIKIYQGEQLVFA